jgi:hypothetical protein
MKILQFLLISLYILSSYSSFAGGGCTPATNTSCATAIALTANAACISGTTCSGGTQSASTCLYTGSQCVWYSFTATATNMVVSIGNVVSSGCHISSNVYSSTGACAGLTQISCQSGAPLDDIHSLSGLIIGRTYYIQVCYAPGGACGNGGSAEFCIRAFVPPPPCNTCASPCGTAAGYATTPSVSTVTANCTTDPFSPVLAAGSTHTFCYSFQATATSVDFNVIITSTCGNTGNVTNFSWSLYNASCGGAIQTGTLASLTFNGLTVGNNYVFCYTFTVPSGCTHSQHCPYFVGATVLTCPTAAINYAGAPFCSTLSGSQAVTLTGTGAYTGGTYSSTTGLTINSSTGAITPSTSTPGTYTVTYTIPAAGTCAAVQVTTTVTISPPPVMTSATTATICSGQTVSIPLTSNPSGSTFTWVATANANVNGESTITQTTSTLSNTLTNSTTSVQTVTYTVTPTLNGCVGTAQTVTVTVNPVPAVPTITSAAATCSSAGTATITNYVSTQSYTFSPSGPSIGAGGVISGMTPGTSYTVTTSNGSCTSAASASFSIAAQLVTPAVPTITSTAATCSSAGTATITNYVSTQSYTFSPSGPSVGAGGVISGMTPGISYTVTTSIGSCTSAASLSFSSAAQLVTPAVPTITSAAATCSSAGTATITNYVSTQSYTFSPSGPSIGAGGVISGMTPGTSYTVTTSNGSCTSAASASFSIAAQLVTPAVPTITSTAATCSSAGTATITNYVSTQSYTFSPSGPSVGAGGVISGMTPGISYTVTTSIGSCTSAASLSFSSAAQLVTPAVPTITSAAATCSSAGTATITNYVSTQSYTFSPSGPSIGAGGVISGMTPGASYTVTTSNASCTSVASSSFSIAAQLVTPTTPTISTTAATCSAPETATITNYVSTQTYAFTPSGPSVGVGGVISGMTPGTSYTVTASNGSCSSAASTSFSITAQLVTPAVPTVSTAAATCSSVGTATIPNYMSSQTYTFSPTGPSVGAGGVISGMTPGTSYTVTTSNGSCTSAASASFSIAAQLVTPAVPTINSTAASCSSAGTATITNYVSTQSYTFSPSGPSVGAAGVISGMTPGTSYTVTTSIGSCTSAASLSFSSAAQLVTPSVPTITSAAATCSSAGTATITNYVSTQSYTFSPSGPSVGAGGVISGMTPGTSYTVTTSNGSCTSAASASFSIAAQFPPAVAGITNNTGTTILTCFTTSISVTATGGTSYVWDNGLGSSVNASITSAGTYTVTVTDANGCTATASITITQDVTLPTVGITNNTGATELTCILTSISVTATGGGAYSWSNGLGTNADATITAAGTYTVTVTGANGCTDTETIAITADPNIPTAGITNNTGTTVLTCTTTSIGVTATGGVSYSWDNGLGTNADATITAVGTYTVTATAANSCTATASIIVTQDITTPTAAITNNSGTTVLTCTTTSISVTATGGTSYSWDGGLGTNANATITAAGTYTVTVTGANGCIATASITITADPSAPIADITNNTGTTVLTCTTTSISVTATGGVSYSWDGGLGTNANATITAPGTYIVTATAANGCTATASITVTQDIAAPMAGITNNTGATELTCTLTSISVTATGGVSYAWDGGLGTNANATITAAGTYTVTVTGANGCTSTAAITITADPSIPTAGITNNTGTTVLTCTTTSISITATGGVSYAWDNGLGTNADATITAPGTYSVTATAANGCAATASITVTQDIAAPTAGITNNTGSTVLTCTLTSISVTATGGVSYAWDGGLGTNANATITAAGTYTVTVTGANGCTSTAAITVTSDTGISDPVTTLIQPTCATPTGTITVSSPLGANYQYSIGGAYQSSATFTGLSAGTYTVTAQDMTNSCVSAPLTVTIDPIPDSPSITLVTQNNITCSGGSNGSIEIAITGGAAPYTTSWNPSAGTGTSISGLTAGNYVVTVTDVNGCSSTASYTITAPAALAITGVANNLICGQSLGSITTTASGGTGPYTYLWNPASQTTTGIDNLSSGNYSVVVTDANGCVANSSFVIGLTGNLDLEVDPDFAAILEGESVDLSVSGATSYVWSPSTGLSCNDCPNPVATPSSTTTYFVTGTDVYGCTGATSVTIFVTENCEAFFVPNIFSPNGTGPEANNTLCVAGGCILELRYQVFNRWGEKIFETTDPDICWDGVYRGEPVGSGVYAYKVYARLSNGEIIERAGSLTVVY